MARSKSKAKEIYGMGHFAAKVELLAEYFDALPSCECGGLAVEAGKCARCFNASLDDMIAAGTMPPDTLRWDPTLP